MSTWQVGDVQKKHSPLEYMSNYFNPPLNIWKETVPPDLWFISGLYMNALYFDIPTFLHSKNSKFVLYSNNF